MSLSTPMTATDDGAAAGGDGRSDGRRTRKRRRRTDDGPPVPPSILLAWALLLLLLLGALARTDAFVTAPRAEPRVAPPPSSSRDSPPRIPRRSALSFASSASSASGAREEPSPRGGAPPPPPETFREGEVIGLRLMQGGRYEEAIAAFRLALTLPGSRPDVLRTPNVPGPSPVGGSKGGTESRPIAELDEFERQAAHYNLACCHANLGAERGTERDCDRDVREAVNNLRKAFEYGFDNYATVRADPDLRKARECEEFEKLMEEYDPNFGRGFINPFGAFGR
ncbi:hypothetical protein ACHAWF_001913 [Thalassiosira exigua]